MKNFANEYHQVNVKIADCELWPEDLTDDHSHNGCSI